MYPSIQIHKKLRYPTIQVSKHWIVGYCQYPSIQTQVSRYLDTWILGLFSFKIKLNYIWTIPKIRFYHCGRNFLFLPNYDAFLPSKPKKNIPPGTCFQVSKLASYFLDKNWEIPLIIVHFTH